MKRITLVSLFSLGTVFLWGQETLLRGTIEDAKTGDPIVYANIRIVDEALGTTSNERGEFILRIPERFKDTGVEISHLGYTTQVITDFDEEGVKVLLQPFSMELSEVVLTPLLPTDYIKMAVKAMEYNYPAEPFETLSYYREKMKENDAYLSSTEAVLRSYYPYFKDSIEGQHQLLLYRQPDELSELQFMKREREKKMEKKRRTAIKRGEDPDSVDVSSESIAGSFGGPSEILSDHLSVSLPIFLDSTKFKKFEYNFAPALTYGKDSLMVIDFKSRRKVKVDPDAPKMRIKGTIYLSLATDAIVAIDTEYEVVLSAAIDAALYLFGFGVSDIYFDQQIRYQEYKGRWYPENFTRQIRLTVIKRRLFKKNDRSRFAIEQVLKVNDVKLKEASPIVEEKRFDVDDDFEEQVYPEEGIDWENVNTLTTIDDDHD